MKAVLEQFGRGWAMRNGAGKMIGYASTRRNAKALWAEAGQNPTDLMRLRFN